MTVERRIRINNRNYFLGVELKYKKDKLLVQTNGNCFDMGDLSIMIQEVESSYKKESKKVIYDDYIPYMNDIIYLYDRFPFVKYIRDVVYNQDREIVMLGCIYNNEIKDYIKRNKIKINRWDKSKCPCPLLYQKQTKPKKIK